LVTPKSSSNRLGSIADIFCTQAQEINQANLNSKMMILYAVIHLPASFKPMLLDTLLSHDLYCFLEIISLGNLIKIQSLPGFGYTMMLSSFSLDLF